MTTLKILQLILSIITTLLVLLQTKSGGLTSSIGGAFTMYRAKRGLEKIIFISTIIFAILLIINSLALIITS